MMSARSQPDKMRLGGEQFLERLLDQRRRHIRMIEPRRDALRHRHFKARLMQDVGQHQPCRQRRLAPQHRSPASTAAASRPDQPAPPGASAALVHSHGSHSCSCTCPAVKIVRLGKYDPLS
jgi:hypothetical protein